MAIEPEQTSLSTEPTSSDAPSSTAVSESESSESSPGWWSRLFSRNRPLAEKQETEQESPTGSEPAQKLELTPEELQRRVQSEVDRREAKRQQDAAIAVRKKLRDEDPWAYAQMDRDAEQAVGADVHFMQQLHQIGSIHDKASIDPLLEMLPESERNRILKLDGAGTGLAGRTLIVKEALKALEKNWKSGGEKEAENNLRTNAAFRKQILAEMRGARIGEPDLLPSASSAKADQTVSRLLRDFYLG